MSRARRRCRASLRLFERGGLRSQVVERDENFLAQKVLHRLALVDAVGKVLPAADVGPRECCPFRRDVSAWAMEAILPNEPEDFASGIMRRAPTGRDVWLRRWEDVLGAFTVFMPAVSHPPHMACLYRPHRPKVR